MARKLTLFKGVCYNSPRQTGCGNSSVVEHNLAKVGVAGSNPVSRSIYIQAGAGISTGPVDLCGGVAKWLRRRSAKPLFSGSNPLAASISTEEGVLLLRPGWRNWETQRT